VLAPCIAMCLPVLILTSANKWNSVSSRNWETARPVVCPRATCPRQAVPSADRQHPRGHPWKASLTS
jgi:hypothetical protein